MAEQKKFVESITPRDKDFTQWYTDVCMQADLLAYSNLKGFMVIKPAGYAIWENIQKNLDARFKATGVTNVYMPLLIPENLMKKEGELVNGFAPEVAWVTAGGTEPLTERLCVRPTSETLFSDFFAQDVHSYRDLPRLYNQWCSVVRWEKETRPFLRSREFLWQEGHTIHETAEEAEARTQQMLNVYADFLAEELAIPTIKGQKTDKEKFAGAEATYTIEALMHDGRALQSGTSHYFGSKFAEAYGIQVTGRDNKLNYVYQTSWGMTTRVIGALIMVHGDDSGIVLPPHIAPTQVCIIPIQQKKEGVLETAAKIAASLSAYRVKVDDSERCAATRARRSSVPSGIFRSESARNWSACSGRCWSAPRRIWQNTPSQRTMQRSLRKTSGRRRASSRQCGAETAPARTRSRRSTASPAAASRSSRKICPEPASAAASLRKRWSTGAERIELQC